MLALRLKLYRRMEGQTDQLWPRYRYARFYKLAISKKGHRSGIRPGGSGLVRRNRCDKVRIEDNVVGHWLQSVIASKTKDAHADTRTQQAELQRQDESIAAQPDQLLHLRIERQFEQRGR